ncbi:MAG: S16 family serine protease [Myxococcota bacterium]
MTKRAPTTPEQRLLHTKVLVQLHDLHDAEATVVEVLDDVPDDLTALSLYAKIKHMRGELSAAMACWAQINARSPHHEWALTHLQAIMHLARDPERGAEEFMALGQFQLIRKSAAHLALEEAFRLFLARKPHDARARCASLAAKYESRDRDIYKLAVLANAWIAELSGEFHAAAVILERLGTERGFETDIDRILALERVYERLGTRDKLQAAVNICHHLAGRFEKISVFQRLAILYRRLGETERAREYDARHLAAFRRRMHQVTLAEVTEVAAERYLPLMRLAPLRLADRELPRNASRRQHALAHALLGEPDRARSLFAEGGEGLDLRYLGDLAVLAHHPDDAVQAYLRALKQDGPDEQVLAWLLDHHARTGSPSVEAFFANPENAARGRKVLEEAVRRVPLRPSLWQQLGALHRLRGELEDAERCALHAEALRRAAGVDGVPVGRVLASAVYHFGGKPKGLIHEVWAGRQPTGKGQGGWLAPQDVLGNLTTEMREGVRNTFLAVREYARAKLPHLTTDILDYHYSYKLPKEDETSGGLSAGLPTALAFLSVFIQRPVPQDVAASGVLVADAHDVLTVMPVGEAEYKVKAACHRNLRALLLPTGCRAGLVENTAVPPAIVDEVVRYVGNLDQAVRLVFGEDIFVPPRRTGGA